MIMAELYETSNKTLLQTFEWHTPSSPTHYVQLRRLLPGFAKLGITSIWLPPGCKADNPNGNGYDIYDLWDLGEFEQKGARRTKWGDRNELDELLRTAKDCRVEVIWDAVINHKQSGDRTESGIWAVEVDKDDRRYEICPPKQIEAWLRYDFPGRAKEGMKYSSMKWTAEHFNGTDWDQSRQKNAIYKLIDDPSTRPPFTQPKRQIPNSIVPPLRRSLRHRHAPPSEPPRQRPSSAPPSRRPGKGWADDVDMEHGNNDYLLFSNVDYTHPDVRRDILDWGSWMLEDIGVQGFRLDAVQHFSFNFTREWIDRVNETKRKQDGRDVFVVGEVWSGDVRRILKWLDAVQHREGPQIYSYDAPLLYNFSRISEDVRTRSKNTDLRTILRNSVLQHRPKAAVTLVTNHDVQPGQTCYTPMHPQLKLLFYAFILLRAEGHPSVFWGDLFGTQGPQAEQPACLILDQKAKGGVRSLLPDLILCRNMFAYGAQKDYWDNASCIGWTRANPKMRTGCAVVLNVASKGAVKRMQIGQPGESWTDVLGFVREDVKIDRSGFGMFPCKAMTASVYVNRDTRGVTEFPVEFNFNIY